MTRARLSIERLAKTGEGVAQHEGRAVFVPGTLPGELVEAEVVQIDKRLRRGADVKVLEPSPQRRHPVCGHFGRCGGCDWLHAPEALQRSAKSEIVESALEKLGGIARDAYRRLPDVAPEPFFGARRRATVHVRHGQLGFFARDSHELVSIDACPALSPGLQPVFAKLPELKPVLKELREIALLEAGGEVAVAWYLVGPKRPALETRAEAWAKSTGVKGVVLVPPEGLPTSIGDPVLKEHGIRLRPDAFAQAHAEGNQALVKAALEALGAREGDRVLELYSGNGNFTRPLAATGAQVTAVEAAKISLALARAVLPQAVKLVEQSAEKAVPALIEAGATFDLLLADPPRTGATGIGGWAKALGPRKVVLVACDPGALAGDAQGLVANGYRPESLQLFDLFPQTHHVEAVMAFERSS